MKKILISVSLIGLIGCSGYSDGQTELLSEKDGVKLYRVRDEKGGRWVYFFYTRW